MLHKKHKISIALVLGILLLVLLWRQRSIQIKDHINQLLRSSTAAYKSRSLQQITQIIVHHSASIGQRAADYARYHVLSKGWPAIGYHFVIETDGTILQTNPLTAISYHNSGQNTRSIGICLSGNFQEQQPSSQQLQSLKKLIRHLRKKMPNALAVYGHRDHGKTSCPGRFLYQHLSQFKRA